VAPAIVLEIFNPYARVAAAVTPFAAAMALRLMLGRSRTTNWLVTLATVWFAVNVLMAPYAVGMRQDIRNLRRLLP
jgi:hypothetical protein